MTANRRIQAIIGLVSNKRTGVDISDEKFRLRGIYKYQGGVVVNDRDIVIKKSFGEIDCYDDITKERNDIAGIVTEVTKEINSIKTFEDLNQYAVDNSGLSEEMVEKMIVNFINSGIDKADPLRSLFLH